MTARKARAQAFFALWEVNKRHPKLLGNDTKSPDRVTGVLIPLSGPFEGVAFCDLRSLCRAQSVLRVVCAHRQTTEETGQTPRGKWRRTRCVDCDDALALDYPT